MSIEYAIELKQISFHYPAANNGHEIIHQLTLGFPQGEITAILGKNGVGKSTLLRCISGALQPTNGNICIHGKDIRQFTIQQLAQQVAVVRPESPPVFAYTVLEMVVMGRTPHLCWWEHPNPTDISIARKSLNTLNLQHLINRKMEDLSSGERQMVLLARALCQSANILLLDEPNNHLDLHNQWLLLQTMKTLAQQNQWTVLSVLHHPELAYWFADRIILMENGQIVANGPPHTTITSENLSRVYSLPVKVCPLDAGHIAIYPQASTGKNG